MSVSSRAGLRVSVLAAMAAGALAGYAAPAAAVDKVKPGLWEIAIDFPDNPELAQAQKEMLDELKKLPPEQRKMFEQMMGGQTGVQLGAGAGHSSRVCLSREMAKRDELPFDDKGDCTMSDKKRSGNTMRFTFTCKNPPQTGEAVYTLHSAEHYTVQLTGTVQERGRTEKMRMTGTARWVSADCGGLKAPAAAKK